MCFPPDGPPATISPEQVQYSRKQQRDAGFQERQQRPRRVPDASTTGWIRRYRKRTHDLHWTVEEHTVVTSAVDLAPADVLHHLRDHWTIENRGHYPRDVRALLWLVGK
jgi:hypothetical protein